MMNKLSPLEELRKEKRLLREDVKQHEEVLRYKFAYAKANLGNILLSSAFSYSLGSMKNMFGFGEESGTEKKSFLDRIMVILPGVWTFIKPVVIGLITKKLTAFFFGNKKK